MRRIKATVCITKEGKVGEAYTGDRLIRDVDTRAYEKEIEGYIEVPLKKGTSRAKGNNLELDVAKVFSTWLYGQPDILKRTPLSGGWGSGKLGDITMDPAQAVEHRLVPPNIYVECKNREGVMDESFWRYLSTGSPSTIGDWVLDTQAKAEKLRALAFLVLKGRATEPFVFVIHNELFTEPVPQMGSVSLPYKAKGCNVMSYAGASFFALSKLGEAFTEEAKKELRGS